jgi:hypothetical protein
VVLELLEQCYSGEFAFDGSGCRKDRLEARVTKLSEPVSEFRSTACQNFLENKRRTTELSKVNRGPQRARANGSFHFVRLEQESYFIFAELHFLFTSIRDLCFLNTARSESRAAIAVLITVGGVFGIVCRVFGFGFRIGPHTGIRGV